MLAMRLNLASGGGGKGAGRWRAFWNELQLGVSSGEDMLPGSTKASNFSRQVRNPDFYKIHNLKIFICWLKLFFRTLAGLGEANKTSLCSRCSPWGIGLQLLLKYSFWNNLVYMVWFYGFYLICISSSFLLNIASHWLLFHSFLQLSPTSVSPAQIP